MEDSPTSTLKAIDDANSAVDVNTTDADGDGGASSSALVDNIAKKGKNAYYYAHAHKATGPKWDGKIEPRLLSTSSNSNITDSIISTANSDTNTNNDNTPANDDGSPTTLQIQSTIATATSNLASSKATLMAKSNITNYAFLNETAKVKLYVNLPGVGNCSHDNIALDFTERSLCLTIKEYVRIEMEKPKEEKGKYAMKGKTTKEELEESDDGNIESPLVMDTAPKEEEVPAIEHSPEDKCLAFGKLFGEIENATYKKKPDKLIIILKKKDKRTWRSVVA